MDISITLLNKLYFLYSAADSIMHKKHGKFNFLYIEKRRKEWYNVCILYIFTTKERYYA